MMAFHSSPRHGFLLALAASIAVHAAILTWNGAAYRQPPAPLRATVIAATLVAAPPVDTKIAKKAHRREAPLPQRPPVVTPRAAAPEEPAREPAVVLPAAAAPGMAGSEAPVRASVVVVPEAPAKVAAAPKPIVSEADTAARYLHNPPPQYPWEARRRGFEGRVILRVEILQSGETGRIEVRQSSGHDVLDQAAIKAVSGWRFSPVRMAGAAVTAWAEVPISFRLTDR